MFGKKRRDRKKKIEAVAQDMMAHEMARLSGLPPVELVVNDELRVVMRNLFSAPMIQLLPLASNRVDEAERAMLVIQLMEESMDEADWLRVRSLPTDQMMKLMESWMTASAASREAMQ